ncbi:hypothetical protein TWF106_000569 [Orbilia oligospora]|uniref:Uncharacterized protein n=1 Tax=Orbilia oligospora TaxID=2813651 RepID=A0A6G1MJ67_ORBOL|nr:hypothetical protein TWF106_000569 [Orbilia oligospora]KAF3212546.1 hypothetical protein TWF679_005737 [Orbilia oligospora]KAF3213684.1 hypothetical protein TWF191_009982 [Orbilia oligospora]KAF3258222.1 hypothetical protein TWF192_000358 [Orbilia oligospora]
MPYESIWLPVVTANRTPLRYLVGNSTIIHQLQDNYCRISDSNESPDLETPTLTTLTSVIGDIVANLDAVIPMVQIALDSINRGEDLSELGISPIVASGPQDLALVSNLRDQLQEYLFVVSGFQNTMLISKTWFDDMPVIDKPFATLSQNISPFLCIIWKCIYYDVHGQPIPFPGSNPADILAASNAVAVTVDVDPEGREEFTKTLDGFKRVLDIQIEMNKAILEWFAVTVDNRKYNLQSLLPEWWINNHGSTIESVISRIDNWVYCWKIWAPLDSLIRAANSIKSLSIFLPISEGSTLVARPGEGWPWEN